MRRLSSFTFVTLNGFTSGPGGDISWHRHGKDENQFAAESLQAGNTLLFGRKTYEMMASYWPTPLAVQNDPEVADGMNSSEKIVFSKTMKEAGWQNTKIVSGNIVQAIRKLKKLPGNNMTLLGSGTILSLFAENGLIDEYQIMIDPVVICNGSYIFNKIKYPLNLKLTNVKSFKSGVVLLSYSMLTDG